MPPSLLSMNEVTDTSVRSASKAWCRQSPFAEYTIRPSVSRLQMAPDRSSSIGVKLRPIERPEQTARIWPAAERYKVAAVRIHSDPSRPASRFEMELSVSEELVVSKTAKRTPSKRTSPSSVASQM